MQCIYYIEKCSLIYCVLGERKVEAVLNGVCELHLGGIDNPQRGQNSEVGDCFILHYFMDLYGVAHHLTSPIVAGNIPWSIESKFISNHFNPEVLRHARCYVWGRRLFISRSTLSKRIPSIHKSSETWGQGINLLYTEQKLKGVTTQAQSKGMFGGTAWLIQKRPGNGWNLALIFQYKSTIGSMKLLHPSTTWLRNRLARMV